MRINVASNKSDEEKHQLVVDLLLSKKRSSASDLEILFQEENIVHVKYERLIGDQESVLEEMYEKLVGLGPIKINEGEQYKELIPESQKHLHENISKGPLGDRIDGWREEMSLQQISVIDAITGWYLIKHSYRQHSPNPRINWMEKFGYRLSGFWWRVMNFVTLCIKSTSHRRYYFNKAIRAIRIR